MVARLRRLIEGSHGEPSPNSPAVVALALVLVAGLTAALLLLTRFLRIEHVSVLYLVPVLVAATRWGVVPAVVAAISGIAASAYFFYRPLFDLRVQEADQLIDLALFIVVAVVTGRLASNLRRAKMREQADALREALIDSVSHELRTPLSTIIGSTSILAQAPEVADDARLAPLLRGVREEAERLDGRIRNLLDATRISSDGVRPRAEWVEPADIVNAALESRRTLTSEHVVDVSVTPDLPFVHVDPVLVENAFGHMIENAAKYSPKGSTIRVRAAQVDGDVTLAVSDQGIGLSAEACGHAWDRFYRGEHGRDVAGSGLGLWIARALVEANGGRVSARSGGPGCGATFAIHLPVHADSVPASAAEVPDD